MPTSADVDALIDTSVAVAIVVSDHEHHRVTLDALGNRRVGLSGHAAFETFSVLTRLPSPARRPGKDVVRLLEENFPGTRYLSPATTRSLLARLGPLGIGGGSVYDALVGAAAAEHALPLLSRDRRAASVYRMLDVTVELLG